MPSESKSSSTKITVRTAATLREKFNRHCKKLNVSAGQRIRDLIQADIKLTAGKKRLDESDFSVE